MEPLGIFNNLSSRELVPLAESLKVRPERSVSITLIGVPKKMSSSSVARSILLRFNLFLFEYLSKTKQVAFVKQPVYIIKFM